MAVQLVTRIADDVAASIDKLVEAGRFSSRSDVVRAGVAAIVEVERRRAIGEAIVDGYRRLPQGGDELWSDAASAAMIAEEPW
jgi:Arc/MetJ-type ribon-helix-helix transcriptional regulator